MIEFTVPDMTCGGCVASVTRALKNADPACEVKVDLQTKQVQVDSRKPRDELAGVLVDAGFTPA